MIGKDPGVTSYRTIVVGTDGSESSLRAVARAGAPAGAADATPLLVRADLPTDRDDRGASSAGDGLRGEAYQVGGSHPAEEKVRGAAEQASAEGAKKVKTIAVVGSPVEVLLDV